MCKNTSSFRPMSYTLKNPPLKTQSLTKNSSLHINNINKKRKFMKKTPKIAQNLQNYVYF